MRQIHKHTEERDHDGERNDSEGQDPVRSISTLENNIGYNLDTRKGKHSDPKSTQSSLVWIRTYLDAERVNSVSSFHDGEHKSPHGGEEHDEHLRNWVGGFLGQDLVVIWWRDNTSYRIWYIYITLKP